MNLTIGQIKSNLEARAKEFRLASGDYTRAMINSSTKTYLLENMWDQKLTDYLFRYYEGLKFGGEVREPTEYEQ